jgi:hypothetical protein
MRYLNAGKPGDFLRGRRGRFVGGIVRTAQR